MHAWYRGITCLTYLVQVVTALEQKIAAIKKLTADVFDATNIIKVVHPTINRLFGKLVRAQNSYQMSKFHL